MPLQWQRAPIGKALVRHGSRPPMASARGRGGGAASQPEPVADAASLALHGEDRFAATQPCGSGSALGARPKRAPRPRQPCQRGPTAGHAAGAAEEGAPTAAETAEVPAAVATAASE
eukprot:2727130-Pyramimonas_sp.AAC.1